MRMVCDVPWRSVRLLSISLLLSLGMLAYGQAGFPTFRKHVVDSEFQQGYQVCIADVDRDGRLDIVALSTNTSTLRWYRNPDWELYPILSEAKRHIDAAPYDVDGDGDADLALASDFDLGNSTSGGKVHWLECPNEPKTQHEWTMHYIDAIPTSHRVRWADVSGDGRKELVNLPIIGVGAQPPDYEAGVQFKAYVIPANAREDDWGALLIDDALNMAHGIGIVDWNSNGRADILTASFDGVYLYEKAPESSEFTTQQVGIGDRSPRPKQGSSEVGLGWLESVQKRFVATIEPWHGHQVVVYVSDQPRTMPWSRAVIDETFNDGHGLACADLDGDGDVEIVAGHRGADYNLFGYRYEPDAGRWQRFPIDSGGISVAGLAIADLNQDGAPDIVATGTATNNVVWYENLTEAAQRE